MDEETRARFDRFDRYFELIQEQLGQGQGQITTMQGQITTMQGQITAMQGQITDLQTEQKALRIEMAERFQSIDDQFRTLSMRVEMFEGRMEGQLIPLREHVLSLVGNVQRLDERMNVMETSLVGLSGRIDTFGEEMRQRFRVVNDRLGGIEKRDAA